jgi:hypothetical protein
VGGRACGDEDAESEGAAELVEGVDQAGGGSCVVAVDAGQPGGGHRDEREPLPTADEHHRQRDGAQVAARGVDAAEPGHASQGGGDTGGQYRRGPEAPVEAVDAQRDREVHRGHRQEGEPGLQRGEAEDAQVSPADEKPIADSMRGSPVKIIELSRITMK